jgi:hypothetical protein
MRNIQQMPLQLALLHTLLAGVHTHPVAVALTVVSSLRLSVPASRPPSRSNIFFLP